MISYCNRRLYKGNSYEICLPITDTGVTSVRFYTSGDIVIEKEGKIVDDTMCFELTKSELDLLPDGVLRYSYADFDSNTKYVIVTPADYSGSTLEDIIADAFESGHTAGYDDGLSACTGGNVNLIENIEGTYFVIPEGTTKIRYNAFQHACFSPITIPSSVTEIGNYAFAENDCLKEIVVPSSVQIIGMYAFSKCQNLTSIIIENSGMTSIGSRMCRDNPALREVKLPDALTALPDETFADCKSLTTVTIPSGVTKIGIFCFAGCKELKTITIPAGVTSIGQYCFSSDSDMTSMTFEGTTPPKLEGVSTWNASLGDTGYTWPIYVPCSAVEDYKTAWPIYAHRISCQQEPEPEPDYSAMPLTFSILSDGYINWHVNNVTDKPDFQRTIYYSKDSGNTWNSITSTVEGTHIPVLSGETVMFKGDNSKYSEDFENSTKFSGTTCEYDVYGNIMSLINSTGYTSLTALTENFQFFGLFGDTPVRSAEHLILPAMELTRDCYRDLFIRCANLTTAPVLPAQHVPENSYYFMFYCCKHLTYIKCLATSLSVNATLFWVGPDTGADVLPRYGTFVKSPDMHDWNIATEENYVTDGIPLGWTVVDDQS